jgi:hypothetical protein
MKELHVAIQKYRRCPPTPAREISPNTAMFLPSVRLYAGARRCAGAAPTCRTNGATVRRFVFISEPFPISGPKPREAKQPRGHSSCSAVEVSMGRTRFR